jgi:hypothetical protein
MVITNQKVKRLLAILMGGLIVFTPATVIALTENSPDKVEVHQIDTRPIEGLSTPIIGVANVTPTSVPTIQPKIKKTPRMTQTELTELQREAQTLVIISWGLSEWDAFNDLVNRESGWNPRALNKSSGACGIPQALPCNKLPQGINTEGIEQVKWMIKYVQNRYGSPTKAIQFHNSHHWY